MAVSIIPRFTKAEITAALNKKREVIAKAILFMLQRIGEQFVANARNVDTYKDRTVNLRSSIGYVILRNGVQVKSNFSGNAEGVATAKKVIQESADDFSKGFVLICVAGMDYAAAVESKGYDVITASSLIAEINLKQAIARIKLKAA